MEPNYRSSEEIAAAEDGYVIREDNADYFALVPASGREVIAQALKSGQMLNVNTAVIGDGEGNYVLPSDDITGVIREVWRGTCEIKPDNDNPTMMCFAIRVPVDVGGWDVREIAILTEDDTLLVYANAPGWHKLNVRNGTSNPMDININYADDDDPLSLKSDFILSLCELVVGGKNGLEPVEKTIIDRCVRLVYQDYLADPVPEKMPILEDLYNLLRKQEEPEAQRLATSLEIYVTGSLNVFNHQTNVDINNRIVCFDIKQLGKQLKKLGMLIVQDAVWGRVTANRSAGKSTRYYADEFHLLLKEEQTAAYSVEIWKRFRKWGGIPTALTQNVKDLLASPEVSNIFENSDFVYMLNQANGDRQILAKQLNISPHQLSYVTHSGEGEGLLFFGNVILPFVDRFPTDLELYRIMTTKLGEVSEGTQK